MLFDIDLKLNEYLEFNSNLILSNNVLVYGGAIRDIIANQTINDVDILTNTSELGNLCKKLYKFGYIKEPENIKLKNIYSNYSNKYFILYSFTKGNKNVQLIVIDTIKFIEKYGITLSDISKLNFNLLKAYTYITFLMNVDINVCGIFYNGVNVYESISNSISYILKKEFCYLSNNMFAHSYNMYERRVC
jgi:hypothetical protein